MAGTSDLDGFEFSRGCFYPPTVLEDVGTEDELWREEVFGPVVVVKKFEVCRRLVRNHLSVSSSIHSGGPHADVVVDNS